MTRRRADTATPYADLPVEQLTDVQRVAAQQAIIEQYEGRKDREAWDHRFWRGRDDRVFERPRAIAPRTGSQRGSPWSRKAP